MKKTLSAALAVIIAMLALLAGCSGEQKLTEQQYLDELMAAFKQYKNALVEINDLISAKNYDVDKVKSAAESGSEALDKTEKLKAPSGYEDYQERLIKSLDTERKFISYNIKICEYGKKQQEGTISAEEANELTKLTDELTKMFEDEDDLSSSYPSVILELVKKLKEAGCTVSTSGTSGAAA